MWWLWATVGCLATVSAALGNLFVVGLVMNDRRLKSRKTNFLISSLAVADAVMALLVMPFALVQDLSNRWYFGSVFCRVWVSSDVLSTTASILNLCVIACDRYKRIKDPLHYETWMSLKRVLSMITGVWTLSAVVSFAVSSSSSSGDLCRLDMTPIWAITSSAISFYVPSAVTLIVYVRIYVYARRHRRRTGGIGAGKAAATLGVIVGVFLVCWTPFFVVHPLVSVCGDPCDPSRGVFTALTWLGYVNSCFNPIIYTTLNLEFRSAIWRSLGLRTRVCATH